LVFLKDIDGQYYRTCCNLGWLVIEELGIGQGVFTNI
jgi:hypothetical protein